MSDARLDLIRFITRRHADLQGLRDVAFAICVLAVMGLNLWVQPAPPVIGRLVVFAGWVALSESSTRLVDWFYASRYGRVSGSTGSDRSVSAPMLMGLGAALDLTPWFPLANASGFVLAVAASGAWIAYRDFPWRGYHLALAALPAVAPVVHPGAALLGYFPAYAAALAALAAAGVLDHLLLRTTLKRLQKPGQMESRA